MAELTLNDVDRDAFAGEFDSVRVPQLVWCEAASDPGLGGEFAELGAGSGG